MTGRQFARIAARAVGLLLLFDVLQAAAHLDRRLESLSMDRLLTPPAARLDIPRDYPTAVAWRLDPLLDAHEIGRPKGPGEYRVAVLGDSGTFDYFSAARDAVPGQMTRLARAAGGRRLRAYNLAYQTPNTLKDLLILEHALKKEPDAVVWFVTLYDLARDAPSPYRPDVHLLLRDNEDDLAGLERDYGVNTWETRELARSGGWWRRSILFRGARYRDYALLLARSLLDALTPGDPSDSRLPERPWVGSQPLPDTPLFRDLGPNDPPMPNARWQTLLAGAAMARARGVRLVIVNDPIFIAKGRGADRLYNAFYSRSVFDRYRAVLAAFCREHGLEGLDLWNLVPPEEFGNTPQHYRPEGNARIARAVVDHLTGEGKDPP